MPAIKHSIFILNSHAKAKFPSLNWKTEGENCPVFAAPRRNWIDILIEPKTLKNNCQHHRSTCILQMFIIKVSYIYRKLTLKKKFSSFDLMKLLKTKSFQDDFKGKHQISLDEFKISLRNLEKKIVSLLIFILYWKILQEESEKIRLDLITKDDFHEIILENLRVKIFPYCPDNHFYIFFQTYLSWTIVYERKIDCRLNLKVNCIVIYLPHYLGTKKQNHSSWKNTTRNKT